MAEGQIKIGPQIPAPIDRPEIWKISILSDRQFITIGKIVTIVETAAKTQMPKL